MSDEMLEILKDVVNQACSVQNGDENEYYLDTLCISVYEEAISYLVSIGEAKWIKKWSTARWINKEAKEDE